MMDCGQSWQDRLSLGGGLPFGRMSRSVLDALCTGYQLSAVRHRPASYTNRGPTELRGLDLASKDCVQFTANENELDCMSAVQVVDTVIMTQFLIRPFEYTCRGFFVCCGSRPTIRSQAPGGILGRQVFCLTCRWNW